jgi:CRP-like cAMP-binding protein
MGHKHSKKAGKKGVAAAAAAASTATDAANVLRNIKVNPELGATLKAVPLLSHLSNSERAKLAGALDEKVFGDHQVIFNEGDKADGQSGFYIISEGSCVVEQGGQVLCQLNAGDYIGEQSLLHGTDRNATIKGGPEGVSCWLLTKLKFETLFQADRINVEFLDREKIVLEKPRLAVTAEAMAEFKAGEEVALPTVDMPDGVKQILVQAVQNSLLFASLDTEHKAKVAGVMTQQEVKSGTTIIEQGEEGNTFYVIEEGSVDVYQWNYDTEENVKCDYKRV